MRIICVLILIFFSFLCEGQMQSFLRSGGSEVTNNLAAGCLHCWDFGEGSGTSAADEFGSKTLTFVNAPTWVPEGTDGYNLSIGGEDFQYLYNNNISDINFDLDTDDFTVYVRYKGDSTLLRSNYLLGYNSGSPFSSISTMVRFGSTAAPTHTSYSPFSNYQATVDVVYAETYDFTHIVWVYTHSDNTMTTYVNGSEQSTTTFSISSFTPASSTIFRVCYVDGNYMTIQIDSIAYWDIALDSTQVSALYNSGASLACQDFN